MSLSRYPTIPPRRPLPPRRPRTPEALQDYFYALRQKLETPECSRQYPELRGICARTAEARGKVLRVFARHLDGENRRVMLKMREHFAPYYGLSRSGGPDFLACQSNPACKFLEEAGLVELKVGRHGSYDLRFTDLGFQVSQFLR